MQSNIVNNKKSSEEQETAAASFLLPIPLTPSGVVQGIVFSELLGRPKALKKGRWQR